VVLYGCETASDIREQHWRKIYVKVLRVISEVVTDGAMVRSGGGGGNYRMRNVVNYSLRQI
jgi:hypothetical protein